MNVKYRELGVGLVVFLIMSALAATHALDPVESLFLDFRFKLRGAKPFPDAIAVIGIDEASLDHPKSGPWPWTRENYAQLLYVLSQEEYRPRVIGYDLLFEDELPHMRGGDESFAYRAEEFSGRVAMAYFFEKGYVTRFERDPAKEKHLRNFALTSAGTFPGKPEEFDKVSLPYLDLAKVTELGFSNLSSGKEGRTYRVRLLANYRGQIYPSLDLMLILRYLDADMSEVRIRRHAIVIQTKKGLKRVIPISPEGDMWLNYYGKLSERVPYYSFIEVMLADKTFSGKETLKKMRAFKDKIVLIGQTATSLRSNYMTPFEQNVSGVFVHAQALANILKGDFLIRTPAWLTYVLLFAISFSVVLLVNFARLARALPAAIGLAGLYFAANYLLFLRGIWMELAVHELAILFLCVGMISFRYFMTLEELRRTQSQLIHSAKMATIGQISSGMAHEFRNILHAIQLHVEGCTRPGMSTERIQKYMTTIFKILENADLILTGILSFARRQAPNKKIGDLKKTVENTLLLMKRQLMYHKIRVQTQLDAVAPVAYDAGQLSQVLLNLLNNARDALRDNQVKLIMIRLKEDDQGVYLDIGDNGPGIPPHVMKHLFEPFVTTKGEGKGTGLGLSMCRNIIRDQGGDITVTTVPGQGTVWHVHLPKNLP